jgi:hypothetical protein
MTPQPDNNGNREGRAISSKLSDYPEGNLDDIKTGGAKPEGKTIDQATNPSKLSDI